MELRKLTTFEYTILFIRKLMKEGKRGAFNQLFESSTAQSKVRTFEKAFILLTFEIYQMTDCYVKYSWVFGKRHVEEISEVSDECRQKKPKKE